MHASSPTHGQPAEAAASAAASATASARPAASSAIPFKPVGSMAPQGVGLPAALLICLLLLAVLLVLLRRGAFPWLTSARPARALQVMESRTLGDRMRVSVLHYRGRELLVAHSEHVVSVLAEGPAESPQEPRP